MYMGAVGGCTPDQGLGGSGVPPSPGVGGLRSGTCFTSCLAACLRRTSEGGVAVSRDNVEGGKQDLKKSSRELCLRIKASMQCAHKYKASFRLHKRCCLSLPLTLPPRPALRATCGCAACCAAASLTTA